MSKNSVCFINLKGGVGKSTLSVAFAEYLAFVRGKEVLLIDGDPQCNSTAMLVGPEEAQNIDKTYRTSFDLLRTVLDGEKEIDFGKYVRKSVSNIHRDGQGSLDLLPSTIRFADWDNLLVRAMAKIFETTSHLHRSVSSMIDRMEKEFSDSYDWVVVDAPPSFGNQARLAMRLARYAVVPTTPDPLACHGTNYVIESLHRYNLRTVPACVVISKYREQSNTARKFRDAMLLRKNPPVEGRWPKVIRTVIPEATAIQRISDYGEFEERPKSFRNKYGDKANVMKDMSEEILKILRSYQTALE